MATSSLGKAAELLVHSSLSPGEAARCVGIHDLYYFSRIFKKLKGCAPSRFKSRWEEISSLPAAPPIRTSA
ncbi:helix-turn-helix domain-containing protein [Paenibacillus sp.]|uniref:helix-turn-helix domain-containing protein n=1 Tax=Paenibacillus sp. TaxID=58172 RepID=UPI0039C90D13